MKLSKRIISPNANTKFKLTKQKRMSHHHKSKAYNTKAPEIVTEGKVNV